MSPIALTLDEGLATNTQVVSMEGGHMDTVTDGCGVSRASCDELPEAPAIYDALIQQDFLQPFAAYQTQFTALLNSLARHNNEGADGNVVVTTAGSGEPGLSQGAASSSNNAVPDSEQMLVEIGAGTTQAGSAR